MGGHVAEWQRVWMHGPVWQRWAHQAFHESQTSHTQFAASVASCSQRTMGAWHADVGATFSSTYKSNSVPPSPRLLPPPELV